MNKTTLDEALDRIKELENEISELKADNKKLRNRNFGGRKKRLDFMLSSEWKR